MGSNPILTAHKRFSIFPFLSIYKSGSPFLYSGFWCLYFLSGNTPVVFNRRGIVSPKEVWYNVNTNENSTAVAYRKSARRGVGRMIRFNPFPADWWTEISCQGFRVGRQQTSRVSLGHLMGMTGFDWCFLQQDVSSRGTGPSLTRKTMVQQ